MLRWGLPFLVAFLLVRLVFWGLAFPNPDEAYYWLWGQHWGASYYDHPPFHGWVQGLFARMFGRSTGVLRLPNLLSNGILLATFWQICRYWYRDRTADYFWTVVLLLLASPLFFLFLAMAWNDHWLVTFAVLSSYAFIRFVDRYRIDGRGHSPWLYLSALTLGLAGLCKYTALLVGLAFLATLLSHRPLHRLFRDPRLYGAVAIALLPLIPILIWNLQNDFFSFRYYIDRNARASDFSINLFQPLVFLLLCGLILGPVHVWAIWHWQRTRSAASPTTLYPTLALWLFTVSTLSFTLLSAVSVALYYWNILAYPLLFPLMAGVFLHDPRSGTTTPTKRFGFGTLRTGLALGWVAAAALVFHYTVIPIPPLVGGTADNDSAALYGWQDIAAAVQQQAEGLETPLLLTTDYRSASALAYALNRPDVWAISGRLDQFDFWYDAATMTGRDAVLLGETWHPICPAHLAMFERTDPPITVEVKRFGKPLQTYSIRRAYGFQAGDSDRYPLRPDYPLAFTTDGEVCQ